MQHFILFLSNCNGQTKNLTDLKQSVDQSWKTTNPVIKETKPSFFNETNHSDFLILDLNFSGYNIAILLYGIVILQF